MRGRQRSHHRHPRQHPAQGQHRLDTLAGRHHLSRGAEPNGMAEERAHGLTRRLDRRLAGAGWVEPCAMHASDRAAKIGDTGNHRRPILARRLVMCTVVAPRVKAQRSDIVQTVYAAMAKIGFHQCAGLTATAMRRRAASGEPVGAGTVWVLWSGSGSGRGR